MTTQATTSFTSDQPPMLIRERELAQRWHKSPRTLQRWRRAGHGPAWLRLGGSVVYRLADILAFEEASRHQGGRD